MDEADPEITVIIPVFNGEDLLPACLDSIESQSLRDLEIIIVDDGSTDGTADLLAHRCARDHRIRLLSTDHSGAAAARNAALDVARGRWVMFVDADDMLLDRHLLFAIATTSGADLVTFDSSTDPAAVPPPRREHDSVDRRNRTSSAPVGLNEPRAGDRPHPDEPRPIDPTDLAPSIVDESFNPVWNKAYRRELLVAGQCRFPTGIHLGEDLLFNLAYIRQVRTVLHLDITGYYYRRDNPGSVTRRFFPGKHQDLMTANDALRAWAADADSDQLRIAADFIRAKNVVSCMRDLHHPNCPGTHSEKLVMAGRYRRSAPRTGTAGLSPMRRLFSIGYNLTGPRLQFALAGVLFRMRGASSRAPRS